MRFKMLSKGKHTIKELFKKEGSFGMQVRTNLLSKISMYLLFSRIDKERTSLKCLPKGTKDGEVKQTLTFSAFWLRSSVVSVLISLISDSYPMG